MITIKEIELMKKDSFLINTARGGIINESDLFKALESKMIAGAAIDVFELENKKSCYVNNSLKLNELNIKFSLYHQNL